VDAGELAQTAARALAVYALMLVVIRVLGKRTVGNFTAFDLLVALMLGEVVDEIVYGDVTLAQGVTAIAVVALAHYANSWLSYMDVRLGRVLEGAPVAVVRDGALVREGMRGERMNEKDVMAELRHEGITDLREVKLAMVEVDGVVTVQRHDWAEPVQKADLGGEHARQKRSDLAMEPKEG
jgi:uncharacterized membrane protein YcaP (DUF421 family)